MFNMIATKSFVLFFLSFLERKKRHFLLVIAAAAAAASAYLLLVCENVSQMVIEDGKVSVMVQHSLLQDRLVLFWNQGDNRIVADLSMLWLPDGVNLYSADASESVLEDGITLQRVGVRPRETPTRLHDLQQKGTSRRGV